MAAPLKTPFALDAIVSAERLRDLLAFETEYPELDFKATVDPLTTEGLVELAADVGAMQVRAGYIVAGVDGKGRPCDGLRGVDVSVFDEATLRTKLLKYLPEPVSLRAAVHEVDGHRVALIFIAAHPSGCVFFRADGKYVKNGKEVVRFRKGDVFWRHGTSSERLTQSGLVEILERGIANAKSEWLDEHQELQRREREDAEKASEALRVARSVLGSVNLDLPTSHLTASVLELVRDGDRVALIHLFRDTAARARGAIERDEIETELGDLLDKLACLGATFLLYEQQEWFDRVVAALAQIYSLAVRDVTETEGFGYSTQINPSTRAPRIWLEVIERVFALGALAVRLKEWEAVRTLTLQLPERIDSGYEANWLRHALTMASRAQHLDHVEGGRTVHVSLLTLAREHIERLECLRPDGIPGDADELFTALAQFDVLSNIAAVSAAGSTESQVFYTNFARFRQSRIDPIVRSLLTDSSIRRAIFPRDDGQLADALRAIAYVATREGFRYDGFMSWDHGPIGDFISRHAAPTS